MTTAIFSIFLTGSNYKDPVQQTSSTGSYIPRISKLIPLLFIPFSGCAASRESFNSRDIISFAPVISSTPLDHLTCPVFPNLEITPFGIDETESNDSVAELNRELKYFKKLAKNLKLERDRVISSMDVLRSMFFELEKQANKGLTSTKNLASNFNYLFALSLVIAGIFLKVLRDKNKRIKELESSLAKSKLRRFNLFKLLEEIQLRTEEYQQETNELQERMQQLLETNTAFRLIIQEIQSSIEVSSRPHTHTGDNNRLHRSLCNSTRE